MVSRYTPYSQIGWANGRKWQRDDASVSRIGNNSRVPVSDQRRARARSKCQAGFARLAEEEALWDCLIVQIEWDGEDAKDESCPVVIYNRSRSSLLSFLGVQCDRCLHSQRGLLFVQYMQRTIISSGPSGRDMPSCDNARTVWKGKDT